MEKQLNKPYPCINSFITFNYNTILKNDLFKTKLTIVHKVQKAGYKNIHNACLFVFSIFCN